MSSVCTHHGPKQRLLPASWTRRPPQQKRDPVGRRVMQFVKVLRERIRHGEITCSIRLWQRPHVRVGGRYSLPPGEIVVTSLLEMPLGDVTPALARRSGFARLVELLKIAKHGRGRRVFLVEFRYVKPRSRRLQPNKGSKPAARVD